MSGGGFYIFKDVKYAANVVLDIFILINQITDKKAYDLFIEYNSL